MKLTEQQLTLIHARLNVFLTLDILRLEESRYYKPDQIELLTKILDEEHYWALNYWSQLFLSGERYSFDFIERPKCVQEVFSILEMFRKHTDIKNQFKGFDGNEETEAYCVAELILFDLNLYKEIQQVIKDGENTLNSHSPMLPTYRDFLKQHGYVVYGPA